jgi:hypothetical protein
MNCPVCNARNIDGAAFCDNCGTKLDMQAAPQDMPIPQPALAGVAGNSVCPSCQSPVIPGTAFCDVCGAALPSQSQQVSVATASAAGGQLRCANCGAMNEPSQFFCDNCGQPLGAARPIGLPGQGAAPVAPATAVSAGPKLVVAASGVAFDLAGKTKVVIGRADPVSGVNPDVDLTPYGGDEGGVSRRHAELSFNGQQWQIKDLNSTNGSAVNDQHLGPNVLQPLSNGEQIRLGKLVLVFQAG